MERNKAILALIYKIMVTDNKITKKESRYIFDIARILEVPEQYLNDIFANPDGYKLIPPPPEEERMQILYYMLFGMKTDGAVHPNEEKIVYEAGINLGFNEMMLRDMIAVLKKHLDKKLPGHKLIEVIKKYMN